MIFSLDNDHGKLKMKHNTFFSTFKFDFLSTPPNHLDRGQMYCSVLCFSMCSVNERNILLWSSEVINS